MDQLFEFGTLSEERMHGVDDTLCLISHRAIELSTEIDFGVPEHGGKREDEEQNEIFKLGYSKADGYNKKSFHQSGKALDLVPFINGHLTYADKEAFLKIKELMFKAFHELKDQGIIGKIYLHWGGYWSAVDKNHNGTQQSAELGWDAAHWELRTVPQKINFSKELR